MLKSRCDKPCYTISVFFSQNCTQNPDEGITLETSATHHIPQAKNIPYQPLLIKLTRIQFTRHQRRKNSFFKTSLLKNPGQFNIPTNQFNSRMFPRLLPDSASLEVTSPIPRRFKHGQHTRVTLVELVTVLRDK